MFRILRSLAQRLMADALLHGSPSCIAGGMSVGVILGLIPWDNLVSAGLILTVFTLPVNQVAAVMSLLITVGLHSSLAPYPHAFGAWILSSPTTLACLRWFSQIPLVPWLRLNNTMVMGGLSLGLITVVPNWMLLQWWVRRSQPSNADGEGSESEWAELRSVAGRYRKGTAEAVRNAETPLEARWADVTSLTLELQATESRGESVSIQAGVEPQPNDYDDGNLDDGNLDDSNLDDSNLDDGPSRAPASAQHGVVGLAMSTASATSSPIARPSELPLDETHASKTVIRETWIEVVRLRSMGEHRDLDVPEPSIGSVPFQCPPLPSESNIQLPMIAQKTSSHLSTGASSAVSPARDALCSDALCSDAMVMASSVPPVPGLNHPYQQAVAGHGSSDALRYLLRHLAANRANRDGASS
jgi:uncharacterized protein (TIGR03546 family)